MSKLTINVNPSVEPKTTFEDLEPGELFLCKMELYIKVSPFPDVDKNAFNFYTNRLHHFLQCEEVKKVKSARLDIQR